MKDFCRYVNVFQGSGEIDLPKPEGIAAAWYFIKAGCVGAGVGGNLTNKEWIRAGEWDRITAVARALVENSKI